ncbi:MAG: HNH endonuclease [Podoviridae sp. ctbj_2]|nr:MAG: HNH endonuclease [Podoviridae sp. ctbj_2]
MKWIFGFEGLYSIEENGVVRSWKTGRGCNKPGTALSPSLNTKGYPQVVLFDGLGGKRIARVHRLVAEAFLPNPDQLPQVDHINNDKTDNSIVNLRWVTNQANTSKALAKKFLLTKKDGTIQIVDNILQFCRDNSFDQATFYKLVKGQRGSAYGYIKMEVM